ncbi:hypothetical protein KL906_004297 [Ogataea polymorpha]|uniref:uncharacterized protein n=1 Tax=Ogataea polymorpha TaxID=460523 RepID=UPI0007F3DD07|nr:uncharacterized protein OGAPODRAFT_13991 [Ogataea polymorpha]KAG7890190.1 hypothetical protein KL908_004528 [Ogataea polymorpha]KAG7907111.1 hypothetical protein KL906_004297 [Ogataea polymorpha]KAG7914763.1 hypothetical protein KL927_004432 [Ogataea polymorpha]KAG7931182.1 hypothetical protein KL934_004303 [Ogataea polymorpha]OBA15227.1 hypothetical protein OGAPODRAFT_13991 [Ogataea polymorpha]
MGRPRIQFSPFRYPSSRRAEHSSPTTSSRTPDTGNSPASTASFAVSKVPLKTKGNGPLHAGTPVRKEPVVDLDDDVQLDGVDSDAGSYNYNDYNSSVMSPIKLPGSPLHEDEGIKGLGQQEAPIVDISSEFEDSEDERDKEQGESLMVEQSVRDEVDAEATILRVADFVERRRREKTEPRGRREVQETAIEKSPERGLARSIEHSPVHNPERTTEDSPDSSPRSPEHSPLNSDTDLRHATRWSRAQWTRLSRYLRLYRATKDKRMLAPEKLEREFHCPPEEVVARSEILARFVKVRRITRKQL